MYSILQIKDKVSLMKVELPTFLLSLFIAENVFKFGSFTLETMAFAATWFGLGYLAHKVTTSS